MAMQRDFDLADRLIDFAVRVIRLAEALPKTPVGNHIRGHILRSGTSPAPNYAEAQAAESRADFTHKLKIVLKEVCETRGWLRILRKADVMKPATVLDALHQEAAELAAIFATSIEIAGRDPK